MFLVGIRNFVPHVAALLLCVTLASLLLLRLRDGISGYDVAVTILVVLSGGVLITLAWGHLKNLARHYRNTRSSRKEINDFLRVKHRLVNLLLTVPITPTVGKDVPMAGLSKNADEQLLIMRLAYGLKCVIADRIGTQIVDGEEVDVRIMKGFTIPYSDHLPVLVDTFADEGSEHDVQTLDEIEYARHIGEQLQRTITRYFLYSKPVPMAANSLNTATIDDMKELLGFMPESLRG